MLSARVLRALRPTTPAGHPFMSGLWVLSLIALVASAALAGLGMQAGGIGAAGLAGLLVGWLMYLIRHQRVLAKLALAERRMRDGDLGAARAVLSPLLARFPSAPHIQRASGLLLYASGDPLSAASLLESALARLGPDAALVSTLVASYAALNKVADARRAAGALRDAPDVRLALAWSELVALGGDRDAGTRLVTEMVHDPTFRTGLGRRLMLGSLIGVAAAYAGDAPRARAALVEVETAAPSLAHADRAFIGYLGAIALREVGDIEGARRTFTAALTRAEGTIGAALARRERSHLR